MNGLRSLLLPTAALAAACSLAACSGGSDGSGGTTSSTTGSSASSSSAPSSSTSSSTSSSSSSSSSNATTSSGPASAAACTGADVTVKATAAGGAAGHVLYNLVATAKSGHTCTLRGYPGVSLVAVAGGDPIGHPGVRVGGGATTVTLRPGGSATSALQLAQAANYGDRCTQRAATGFNVYLPDQKERIFAAAKATGCTQTSIELLQVKPFTG